MRPLPVRPTTPLALGEETERARLALNLAAQGSDTALISSGDIGIYAMASLVFELLDRQLQGKEQQPGWLQVDIEVIPGISAMQLASSRAGALLGHDFCAVSLSDLLTPWQTIEARLHSAGAGDFVVCIYNPRSQKRAWQLGRAREILLGYRGEKTPVVLGQQLGRSTETLRHSALGAFELEAVDMFTVVCIGNSESKRIDNGGARWVYTPRGYGKKL